MQYTIRDELNTTIKQLDQAIRNHDEWFESLNRQMVCRTPYDQRIVRKDAYRECQFGQWLYGHITPHLRAHPAFEAIEREHKQMHDSAARILLTISEGGTAQPTEYDRFSISMQRLRLEINTLKRELESSYYNLDSLTGANSRIGMLSHLSEQLELVRRSSQQYSIAMIDLDTFKLVNDSYGHIIGDRVLVAVVRHILDNIRSYDRLYRYGGEEFLLSMPHTDEVSAMPFIERLREGIQNLNIDRGDGHTLQITVSIGIAQTSSELSVEDAIQRADQGLYAAKKLGRNCTQIWNTALADAAKNANE